MDRVGTVFMALQPVALEIECVSVDLVVLGIFERVVEREVGNLVLRSEVGEQ